MGRAAKSSLKKRALRAFARWQTQKPDPLTNAVLTTPVFVTYHLGILLIDKRNGADWVTQASLRLVHSSILGYVALTLALACGLSTAAFLLRRRGKLGGTVVLGPIVVESTLWSLGMLVSVGWAMSRLAASVAAIDSTRLDPLEKIVMAAGAGFHEELLFRVVLLSGIALGLRRLFHARPATAWMLAAFASALLFGLAHHLGPGAPPVSFAALGFRTLAGLYLSLVYVLRGFAVAVYTHALYDALVFFVLN